MRKERREDGEKGVKIGGKGREPRRQRERGQVKMSEN